MYVVVKTHRLTICSEPEFSCGWHLNLCVFLCVSIAAIRKHTILINRHECLLLWISLISPQMFVMLSVSVTSGASLFCRRPKFTLLIFNNSCLFPAQSPSPYFSKSHVICCCHVCFFECGMGHLRSQGPLVTLDYQRGAHDTAPFPEIR